MSESEAERVTVECGLDAAPEKVWRALSIPAYRDAWLLPDGDGERFTAEVVEAVPPHRLRLSWREGDGEGELVTFTLEATPEGGTWLRLVHDRVAAPLRVPIPANTNTAMLRAA
ncbi:MAG: hypothetical protein K0Q69_1725 [Devosia sp.]|jgi:uncharacterized protein YndB with AHSA1/START domain|nr:hypothetical protein [Devosia sp.]